MIQKQDKEDLFYFKHSSTLSTDQLTTLIEKDVYATKKEWKEFIELFFLILGSGLFVTGIVFFFAYNWTELSKMAKFATLGTLLCVSVGLSIYPNLKVLYRQIALIASSMLVGVLYAIFGQEYQTGANAYDFFFAWLLSITIWTLVSKSAFQWLFFAVLANTTLYLYLNQVVNIDTFMTSTLFLWLLNIILLLIPVGVNKWIKPLVIANWYSKTLLTVTTLIATSMIINVVFSSIFTIEDELSIYFISTLLSLAWLGALYWYSSRKHDFFALCLLAISTYSIVFTLLIRILEESILSFLIYSIYLIGGSFVLVRYLLKTLKSRHNADK